VVKNASTHTDQASGSARPLLRSGEAIAAGRKSDHGRSQRAVASQKPPIESGV